MTTEKKTAKPRLYFIDFARSIAIIMMLEGHFTGAALANQYRDSSNWLYALWHNLHGLTSPLFFTTSGLIFVYLLTGAKPDLSYFENERVRKGFKRVLELLFWGYAIQLSFYTIGKDIYYGSEWHLDWLYAFHVLQSIGIGIFLLLVLFGLKKICAITTKDNLSSQKLLEKLGLRFKTMVTMPNDKEELLKYELINSSE